MSIGNQTFNRRDNALGYTEQPAARASTSVYTTPSQTRMLKLAARAGDEALRTDLPDANGNPTLFKLLRAPASTIGNWLQVGGSAAAPLAHGPDVAAWGALPGAGAFIGETRQVAELTDASHNQTGAGAAVWRGLPTGWTPEGGTLPPSAGGPAQHALMTVTQDIPANTPIDITATAASYTHNGDATVSLGASMADFIDDERIAVRLGGRSVKMQAIWLTPTTLQFPYPLDSGDQLVVESA